MPDGQVTSPEADYDYISLDYEISYVSADPGDPGQYSVPVNAKIFASEAHGDDRVEIGHLRAIVVRLGLAVDDGYHPFDTLDAHSHETCECMELIDYDEGDYKESVKTLFHGDAFLDNLLLITRVEIKPEHRGHDAGLVAIRAAIDMIGIGCSIVVCKPFPLQFEREESAKPKEFRAAQLKLRKHWARAGFKRVPKTDLYALTPLHRLPPIHTHV